MVKPYNYTDSELITLLIDGELSGEQKGYILERVNSDNTLNRQFKLESAMRKATQSKPKHEPSEKLTADLFDKLGFSNGPAEKPLIPWISTLKKASVFLAAGLAITLIGYYAITSMDSNKNTKNHTQTEKKIPVVLSNSITANTNNTNENTDDKSAANEKSSKVGKETKRTNSTNKDNTRIFGITETLATDNTTIEVVKDDENKLVAKSESAINQETAPTIEEITASNLFNNTSSLGNLFDRQGSFVVQLNPFMYNSRFMDQVNRDNEISVKVMNPYMTTDFMTNGGLALTYYRKWKSGCKIGVEGGIENINRWTYNALTDSKSLTNSQALSLSGILRYDAEFAHIGNVNPFVQTFFGFGTNFNYLYGGTIGLMYNPPLTRFGIQAGYEYRKFEYYFGSDNTSIMSFEKSGATVSLIIKF